LSGLFDEKSNDQLRDQPGGGANFFPKNPNFLREKFTIF